MREIQRFERKVNGENVVAFKTEMTNCNILSVEAGTTGYCGGDAGHGGRTFFKIKNEASTYWQVYEEKDGWGDTEAVEIQLGGDAELQTIIEALEFIVQVLKDGAEDKNY